MERPINLKPLTVRDENSAVNRKKAVVDGKLKSSKPLAKRIGTSLESRKALNDITNKSSILQEAPSQKKTLQSKKGNVVVEDGNSRPNFSKVETSSNRESLKCEKVNIVEEGFLHDHKKCVEAQKAASDLDFWNTVLPGHDSEDLTLKQPKVDRDTEMACSSVVLEEISMSEWLDSWWKSPPLSPVHNSDSFPSSPIGWELETVVELRLKEDDF